MIPKHNVRLYLILLVQKWQTHSGIDEGPQIDKSRRELKEAPFRSSPTSPYPGRQNEETQVNPNLRSRGKWQETWRIWITMSRKRRAACFQSSLAQCHWHSSIILMGENQTALHWKQRLRTQARRSCLYTLELAHFIAEKALLWILKSPYG